MEGFFLVCCQVDEIELKEILLRRYGRYLFSEMKPNEFIEFAVLAIKKNREDEMRGMYHALLSYLAMRGKFMTFNEFYDMMTGANLDWRPAEDIFKESKEIEERLRNGN